MSQIKPYFFVIYSHKDSQNVIDIMNRLEREGINFWVDFNQLQAGVNWQNSISNAIENADGIIVFLSQSSIQSNYVLIELEQAIRRQARIVPILLTVTDLPLNLSNLQYFDLRPTRTMDTAFTQLVRYLKEIIQTPNKRAGLTNSEVKVVAEAVAGEARNIGRTPLTQAPDSIFIVHGQDTDFRDDVEKFVTGLGVTPIVLSKMPNTGHLSLLSKFFQYGEQTQFAVILISADDYGALYKTFYEEGKKVLEFRGRQNVILELGFFYGRLDFERVFILFKPPSRKHPKFEFPSDIAGVLYTTYDNAGMWKVELKDRLKDAGFLIT